MTGYHLYDGDNVLVMVAEHGTPWLPEEESHLLRFAYPNGQPVASMDLSGVPSASKHGLARTGYAVIYDMAVYAIISEYRPLDGAEPATLPHYVLEVDGGQNMWLGRQQDAPYYALYQGVSPDLRLYDPASTDAQIPFVGRIDRSNGESDFAVTIPGGMWQQPALVVLAMVFLVDRTAA